MSRVKALVPEVGIEPTRPCGHGTLSGRIAVDPDGLRRKTGRISQIEWTRRTRSPWSGLLPVIRRSYEHYALSAEAFQIATSLRPSVIITDTALPHGFTGVDLVRQLRSDTRTQHTIIIVVTGHVFPTQRAKAQAAGRDVFLPKRCLPEDLVAAIAHELTTPRPRLAAGGVSSLDAHPE